MFFLFPRLEHPAGWICARYKSLLLLLLDIGSYQTCSQVIVHEYEYDSGSYLQKGIIVW